MHTSMKPLILQHEGVEYDVSNLSMKHQVARVRLYPSLRSIPRNDNDPSLRERCTEDHVNPTRPLRQESQLSEHSGSATNLQRTEFDEAEAIEYEEVTGDSESEPVRLHTSKSVEIVQVARDLRLPVRGSMDTILALKEPQVARHECWSCHVVLGCIDTAHCIMCPFCRCVMPNAVANGSSRTHQYNHDHAAADEPCVGMGFCCNQREIIVASTKNSVQASLA